MPDPVICIFGAAVDLKSPAASDYESTSLECHSFATDDDLEAILLRHRPHVIVTIGRPEDYQRLYVAPLDVRRRWLHYADAAEPERMGAEAFLCYLSTCLTQSPGLVSIFTPTYRTGARFDRTFRSVISQTHANWEWVIRDDSGDDGRTLGMIEEYAARDHRIRIIPGHRSGIIGEVKYEAAMACRGELLVELDHDDELTPDALALLVDVAGRYPASGFFYSDWAEIGPDGRALCYGDDWAYGFGSYRTEGGLFVANAPDVNSKTIRTLVGAPNHLRAWRRGLYLAIGGHNRMLHVADDMDLMIRTFLATTMVRIPHLCYLQRIDGTNTQTARNRDIQRHVRYLAWAYDRRIHERFIELGVDDFAWDGVRGCSDMNRPNPADRCAVSVVANG